MANLGVPVKLLHESVGHVVTVELKTGQVSDCRRDFAHAFIVSVHETLNVYVNYHSFTVEVSWTVCTVGSFSKLSFSQVN